MVKKIKEDAVLIKKLIDKGYKPAYITNKFGFSKQKISYWKNTPIKKVIHRRSKLSEKVEQDRASVILVKQILY